MRSHVSVPKSFLKRWSFKEKDGLYINYYDLNLKLFHYEKINSAFTKKDYYSEKVENLLSNKVESFFGQLLHEINLCLKDKKPFILTEPMNSKLQKALNIQMMRNIKIFEIARQRNSHSLLNLKQFTHSESIELLFNYMKDNPLKDMKFSILINETSNSFLLPASFSMGIIPVKNNEFTFIYVLSHKVAILYGNTDSVRSANQTGSILFINTIEKLNEVNTCLLISEKYGSFACIIGNKIDIQNSLDYTERIKKI